MSKNQLDEKLNELVGDAVAEVANPVEEAPEGDTVESQDADENLFEGGTPETTEKKGKKGKDKDCDDDSDGDKGKGDNSFVGKKMTKENDETSEDEKDPKEGGGQESRGKMKEEGVGDKGTEKDVNADKGAKDVSLPATNPPVIVDARRDAFPSVTKASMASASSADAMKTSLKRVGESIELSEEAMETLKPVFEGVVLARVEAGVATAIAELEKIYKEKLVEAKREMAESVNAYLGYVGEKWLNDNEISLEHSIRNEYANSILEGFAKVIKEHDVVIPEGDENLVDKLSAEKAHLQEQLDEATQEVLAERGKNYEEIKGEIVAEVAESAKLSEAQVEKANIAMENVDFGGREAFKSAVEAFVGEMSKSTESMNAPSQLDDGSEPDPETLEAKDENPEATDDKKTTQPSGAVEQAMQDWMNLGA